MTLTFEHLPESITQALKERARQAGRPLQEVALEALVKGLRESGSAIPFRDLSDIVGTWVEDPAFDEAMKDFDRVDPDLWK